MIITISGTPGSAKSTIAVLLAERLNIERIYMGGIFREMAAGRGETLPDFYEKLDKEPALELETDAELALRMRQSDNLIAEGRIAFLWETPNKNRIDVFIRVDPYEGARRILRARRPDEPLLPWISDIPLLSRLTRLLPECIQVRIVQYQNNRRISEERERYKKLYNIEDHHDPRHFHLIVDSTNTPPEDNHVLVEQIVAFCKGQGGDE